MTQAQPEPQWIEPIQWSTAMSTAPAKSLPPEVPLPTRPNHKKQERVNQSVTIRQSPFWSHAVLWGLLGVTTSAVAWAAIAEFEEAVPTQGKLAPTGAVKEVQAPVAGVVKRVYVKDGQRVSKGERLLSLDPTAAKSKTVSLSKIRQALLQENRFYQLQFSNANGKSSLEATQLKLPEEVASLTKNRLALLAENRVYRAQLSGSTRNASLTPDEVARVHANWSEVNSRLNAAKLKANQLRQQLEQTQIRLSNAKENWAVNNGILTNIEPLTQEGAISRIQYLKQQQEVNTGAAEMRRLTEEVTQLEFAISEAEENRRSIMAQFVSQTRMSLAENEKHLADIDGQLNKAIVENDKKIAEIDNEMSEAKLMLNYQDLRAPADGTVFDLQAKSSGFVTTTSQALLKIVPDDALIAEVYITNKDIGFVEEGMKVDVRVDSFPFSEFGDIKGELIWIGSDALPPTQIEPFYRFPSKIKLERQSLMIKNREVLLQSGMSINANIKIRKRSVLSIFTELFATQVDKLKSVK